MARSFGFIDLCGFTSYTDGHGDTDAVRVLAAFRAVVREVASDRGVRIAKWLGDGAMFVSLDLRNLVETILQIEHQVDAGRGPLALRAGVAAGEVILFEGDDYIGSPVNLAARLCDLADGHRILATTDFADALPPWAECSDARGHRVPGFAEVIPLLSLGRYEDDIVANDPICGLPLPAGREVAQRVDEGGRRLVFCSESCAGAWDEGRMRPLATPVDA